MVFFCLSSFKSCFCPETSWKNFSLSGSWVIDMYYSFRLYLLFIFVSQLSYQQFDTHHNHSHHPRPKSFCSSSLFSCYNLPSKVVSIKFRFNIICEKSKKIYFQILKFIYVHLVDIVCTFLENTGTSTGSYLDEIA